MGQIINRRRVCGGKSLPYDAEIKYIQITTSQYIYLPVRVTSNLISDINCTIVDTNGSMIIWNRYQTTNPQYAYSIAFNQSYIWNGLRVDYGSSAATEYQNFFQDIRNITGNARIIFGNGKLILNGTELALTNTTQVFTSPLDYYVIGADTGTASSPWRLNSMSIKDNDTTIFDLIPVRIGQVGYLYDKVSGQLFGNDGTGSFILGPDKGVLPSGYKQLEYIESTGEQYIDTGYYGNLETDIVIEYQHSNTLYFCFGSRTDSENNCTIIFGHDKLNNEIVGFGTSHDNVTAQRSISPQCVNVWLKVKLNKHYKEISDGENTYRFKDEMSAPFTTPSTLKLCCPPPTFPSSSGYEWLKGKIKSLSITESGLPILNFIPCKNPQNIVGMYDTVEGNFYSSPNGKAFIAGPEV